MRGDDGASGRRGVADSSAAIFKAGSGAETIPSIPSGDPDVGCTSVSPESDESAAKFTPVVSESEAVARSRTRGGA
jgi:hypothetical protein